MSTPSPGGPGYGPPARGQPPGHPHPYGPPPPERQPVPPARPGEVAASFWLWIATTLVGLVAAIVRYASGPVPALGAGRIARQAAAGGALVGIVAAVAGTALYVTFAVFLYRRHNWARIALTVFAGIGIVFGGIGLVATAVFPALARSSATGPVVLALSLLQIALMVAAVVLFYRPRANAWFAAGP